MMKDRSLKLGIATIPSGSTVTKTYNPSYIRRTWSHASSQVKQHID